MYRCRWQWGGLALFLHRSASCRTSLFRTQVFKMLDDLIVSDRCLFRIVGRIDDLTCSVDTYIQGDTSVHLGYTGDVFTVDDFTGDDTITFEAILSGEHNDKDKCKETSTANFASSNYKPMNLSLEFIW